MAEKSVHKETIAISQWFDNIDVLFQNKLASIQSICMMKKIIRRSRFSITYGALWNIGVMDDWLYLIDNYCVSKQSLFQFCLSCSVCVCLRLATNRINLILYDESKRVYFFYINAVGHLQPASRGVPGNRLMRMYSWMGSHFYDWIDHNDVAF